MRTRVLTVVLVCCVLISLGGIAQAFTFGWQTSGIGSETVGYNADNDVVVGVEEGSTGILTVLDAEDGTPIHNESGYRFSTGDMESAGDVVYFWDVVNDEVVAYNVNTLSEEWTGTETVGPQSGGVAFNESAGYFWIANDGIQAFDISDGSNDYTIDTDSRYAGIEYYPEDDVIVGINSTHWVEWDASTGSFVDKTPHSIGFGDGAELEYDEINDVFVYAEADSNIYKITPGTYAVADSKSVGFTGNHNDLELNPEADRYYAFYTDGYVEMYQSNLTTSDTNSTQHDDAVTAPRDGEIQIFLGDDGAAPGVITQAFTNTTVDTSPPPDVSLELEIDRWQPFNSSQGYTVILNETNTTTGVSTYTDVTENASVEVYNITNTTNFTNPIVTVNNTSDALVSYDQTGVVAVNATYDGQTLGNATNLTVGNRNLTNIGIMPPSQWLASFLELDSVSGPHGIGSPTQWVLFIVLIMVGATHLADNGWAGLGGGVLTTILLWILGYVDLGTVLSTVFVVTLLSLALIKARRLRSVNPSGGGGGQP